MDWAGTVEHRRETESLSKMPSMKDYSVSRADSRATFVNEITSLQLVRAIFPQTIYFKGDAVLSQVEQGIYKKHKRRP
jgi:hypothetical protein